MRVVHVLPSLNFGGAERFVADLIPHLRDLGADLQVIVLTGRNPLAQELPENVRVWRLSGEGTIYNLPLIRRLANEVRSIARQARAEILHSHLYLPDVVSRIGLPSGVKSLTTLHAIDEWWLRAGLRHRLKTGLDRLTGWWRDTRFVAVSQDVAQEARKALHIADHQLTVIGNGIPLDRFVAGDRIYGRRPRRRIIQVGRFYPEKNHRLSVEAFEILGRRMPDVTLHFLGDGPTRPEIERLVRARGLSQRVIFHGNIAKVSDELNDADIFWMPSRYEGLSIACAEAMAAGVPVVVADVPGLRSMVKDGESGLLCNPCSAEEFADRSARLLNDVDLMRRLGTQARRHALDTFDIRISARRYMQIYEELREARS